MRILIIGGDGMLGHQLFRSWKRRHEVRVTLRGHADANDADVYTGEATYFDVDVRQIQRVTEILGQWHPQAVVNAVGIVKQRELAKEAIPSIEVNALFPHHLAQACLAVRARLIHLSTDCVFSGLKGNYTERDIPDPVDLYGRTKLLGEVHEEHCLTLRTSIIGLERSHRRSLIEWYLAQRGPVKGYRRAIYTGLTTAEMARAIEHLIVGEPEVSGMYHLSSTRISKYELLESLTKRLNRRDIELQPDDRFVCDRSLDSAALHSRVSYRVPTWDAMLDELALSILERNRSS